MESLFSSPLILANFARSLARNCVNLGKSGKVEGLTRIKKSFEMASGSTAAAACVVLRMV